jgi:hypothetical protein
LKIVSAVSAVGEDSQRLILPPNGDIQLDAMSQQTQTADGGLNVKAILAGFLVVAVLVGGGAGVADMLGWIELTIPGVSLPF